MILDISIIIFKFMNNLDGVVHNILSIDIIYSQNYIC